MFCGFLISFLFYRSSCLFFLLSCFFKNYASQEEHVTKFTISSLETDELL